MASIAKFAKKVDKEAQSGIYTHEIRDQAAAGGGNITHVYPRKGFGAEDPHDEMLRMKMELVAKGQRTGMTPLGMVTVSDEDLRVIAKKRDTEQKANLDQWIGSNFHTNDVVTRAWLQEIYPEYYDAREEEMVNRAKLALRIHLLDLRGPRSPEDLKLYFALQQGLIDLDRDWNVIGPSRASPLGTAAQKNEEQRRFAKGLFNPWAYKSDDERYANASNPTNPFRPTGTVALQKNAFQAGIPGFSGLAVPDKSRYPNFLQNTVKSGLFGGPQAPNFPAPAAPVRNGP